MISVLVPTKNAFSHLPACVESIRSQTLPAAEVIVIDHQSQDGTLEWLSGQTDLQVIQQIGKGLAAARNEGIAQAKGEFIAFLDADDQWLANKLQKQQAILDQHKEVIGVSCHLKKIRDTGEDSETFVAMTPSGFLFRKACFETYGLFDVDFHIGADHEFFMRCTRAKAPFHILPEVLMHKYIHEGNLSHNLAAYRKELMRILRKYS